MRISFLCPAFLVLSASLAMAGTTDVRRDSEAVEIVKASLAAMTNGTNRLPGDFELTAKTMLSTGDLADLKVQGKGRHELRNELKRSGQESVAVFNSGAGRRYLNGKAGDLPLWVTAYASADYLPVVSRMADFEDAGVNVAYLGVEKSEYGEVYHVRLWATPADGRPAEIEELMSEFHVFIDTQSLLVAQIRSYIFSPEIVENRSAVDYYFGDYRVVGDLLVPFEIRRFISGQFDSRTAVEMVRLDSGLRDSLFSF